MTDVQVFSGFYSYYIEFENEPYFQLGLLVNFIFLGCIGILIVVVLLRIFHCLYMKVPGHNSIVVDLNLFIFI